MNDAFFQQIETNGSMRVRKTFVCTPYDGTMDHFCAKSGLYHIKYDDGDEEEFFLMNWKK